MTRRFSLFPWRTRREIARDVDTELAFHLEMRVTELVATGMEATAARQRAQEEFGDLEFTRAYCRIVDERTDRAIRGAERFAGWRQDIGYAWRTLRRSPGFAIVSLVTLALAIGANTAIFSVTRAVLLKPLPYGDPGSLVMLFENQPGRPADRTPTSPPNLVDYRAQQHTFTDMAAYSWGHAITWTPANGDPANITSLPVTAGFFSVLQVRPALGRTFAPNEDTPGNDLKAVLSHSFWQRAFGGDSAAIGQRVILSGRSYEVIGVMPPGFTFSYNEDVWLPLDLADDLSRPAITRKQHWIHPVGRLKPGVSIDAARADLLTIAGRLAAQYPQADSGRFALIEPLHRVMAGDLRPALLLLLGGAAMVLLIACANLANLTLARTTLRRREMAVRAALGAGRGRLVRQVLIESLLLATCGGLLGVGLASVSTHYLLALNPTTLPEVFSVAIDSRVLLFSLALSVGTGLLFGVVPAFDATRGDLTTSLRDGGRGASGGRSGSRVRRILVVTQIALAVVLLVGAGLLVRSFAALTRVPLGFNPSQVLTAQLRADGQRYDSATAVNQLFDGVLESLRTSPGVVAAGGVTMLPTRGRVTSGLRIVGETNDETNLPEIGYTAIRGDYLAAMGIALKAGRGFEPTDTPDGAKVVLINEAAAQQIFPNGDAVGRHIRIGPNPQSPTMQIVGIVGDVHDEGIALPVRPLLYANHGQQAWDVTLNLVVRTAGDPERAAPIIRRAVKQGDPALAVRDIQTMESITGSNLASRRFALSLISSFAAVALLLAAVGIYGVLAYLVTSRTREFGVRLALGATASSVLRLVMREGFAWSLLGLTVGITAAVAGSRLLAASLYSVQAIDATTYLAVTAVLMLAVLVACLVPAIRATRVDPIDSMRAE